MEIIIVIVIIAVIYQIFESSKEKQIEREKEEKKEREKEKNEREINEWIEKLKNGEQVKFAQNIIYFKDDNMIINEQLFKIKDINKLIFEEELENITQYAFGNTSRQFIHYLSLYEYKSYVRFHPHDGSKYDFNYTYYISIETTEDVMLQEKKKELENRREMLIPKGQMITKSSNIEEVRKLLREEEEIRCLESLQKHRKRKRKFFIGASINKNYERYLLEINKYIQNQKQ